MLKRAMKRMLIILTSLSIFILGCANMSDNFNAATTWSASLGVISVVPNSADIPTYAYYPDGHISVLPDGNGKYMMFWGEYVNYRTVGDTQYPESQTTRSPSNSIFGYRNLNVCAFDNGGSWLMSVHRLPDNTLVGFYHAEDHWCNVSNPNGVAWKSMAVTYSSDNGVTWSEGKQIITSPAEKPSSPNINGIDQWGGAGDGCVIWDSANNRWVMYYQSKDSITGGALIRMAISTDPKGAPGTWKKYYNGQFNEPGLGGHNTPLANLSQNPGANPSVHWNTYLEKWIMVWAGWDNKIYISASTDLTNWETPQVLATTQFSGGHAWYPTIIGSTDLTAGQTAKLYYADIKGDFSSRQFVSRTINFSQ